MLGCTLRTAALVAFLGLAALAEGGRCAHAQASPSAVASASPSAAVSASAAGTASEAAVAPSPAPPLQLSAGPIPLTVVQGDGICTDVRVTNHGKESFGGSSPDGRPTYIGGYFAETADVSKGFTDVVTLARPLRPGASTTLRLRCVPFSVCGPQFLQIRAFTSDVGWSSATLAFPVDVRPSPALSVRHQGAVVKGLTQAWALLAGGLLVGLVLSLRRV